MPTTTKMGIVYPSSTDLVKDGATAMGTISTTVDSKTGLVLLNTTSFSAVSSQSITQFNANFENYRILIRITSHNTTAGDHILRVRSGASDASGSDYFAGGIYNQANSATVSSANTNAGTSLVLGAGISGATGIYYVVDMLSPFLAQKTGISARGFGENASYAFAQQRDGIHNLSNSYDGFSIIPTGGTITGKVSVYGYNF
jgi:hypothetical protein